MFIFGWLDLLRILRMLATFHSRSFAFISFKMALPGVGSIFNLEANVVQEGQRREISRQETDSSLLSWHVCYFSQITGPHSICSCRSLLKRVCTRFDVPSIITGNGSCESSVNFQSDQFNSPEFTSCGLAQIGNDLLQQETLPWVVWSQRQIFPGGDCDGTLKFPSELKYGLVASYFEKEDDEPVMDIMQVYAELSKTDWEVSRPLSIVISKILALLKIHNPLS